MPSQGRLFVDMERSKGAGSGQDWHYGKKFPTEVTNEQWEFHLVHI
jgi:hypothetical protein